MYRQPILVRDFTDRERRVLELFHQLTVDMGRESFAIQPSQFHVIGISPSHIQEVLMGLQNKNVLLCRECRYRINPDTREWTVSFYPGYDEEFFKRYLRNRIKQQVNRVRGLSTRESQERSLCGKTNCPTTGTVANEVSQIGNTQPVEISKNGNSAIPPDSLNRNILEKESSKEKELFNSKLKNKCSANTAGKKVKELLEIFEKEFELNIGKKYHVNYGKDQALLKRVMSHYPFEDCVKFIADFFTLYRNKDEFLRQSAMSIGVFSSQINKLIVQQEQGVKKDEHIGIKPAIANTRLGNTTFFENFRKPGNPDRDTRTNPVI